jgi:hypothetical protein
MKKVDLDRPLIQQRINAIVEHLMYSTEWLRDTDLVSRHSYLVGGIETIAHVAACQFVQWLGFDFCWTSETVEGLDLWNAIESNTPYTAKKWRKLVTKYIKEAEKFSRENSHNY